MNNLTEENQKNLANGKLILLYLLKNADCVLSGTQIQKLLYDFEGFNYYYYQHILSDLIEKNYILTYKEDEESLYQVTPEGAEVLTLTENMLPGITKYNLDLIIRDLLKDVKNEIVASAEYIPESDDNFITKCKITEGYKTLFEVNILCTSQNQAKKIAENWKSDSSKYYSDIIQLLENPSGLGDVH